MGSIKDHPARSTRKNKNNNTKRIKSLLIPHNNQPETNGQFSKIMGSFPPTRHKPHKARFNKNDRPWIVCGPMGNFMGSFSLIWAVFSLQNINHSKLHPTETTDRPRLMGGVSWAVLFSYGQFSGVMGSFLPTRHQSRKARFNRNGML